MVYNTKHTIMFFVIQLRQNSSKSLKGRQINAGPWKISSSWLSLNYEVIVDYYLILCKLFVCFAYQVFISICVL